MNIALLKNIKDILQYNHWANQQSINSLNEVSAVDYAKEFPISFINLHGLLNHLFYYDAKYYHKIVGKTDSPIQNDAKPSREWLAENVLHYSQKWIDWINQVSIDTLENCLEDILDLQNHNNYHRGQLNMLMTTIGYKPKSLDIYFYKHKVLKPVAVGE